MKQKFKIDDVVKYNGNIYQIVGIKMGKQSLIYDVKCLKNNFPDEPVSSSIGSCAEDKMELVDFTEPTYTWKPSDEQMEALDWALSLAKNCGEECAFYLRTLQDQLKKLKE